MSKIEKVSNSDIANAASKALSPKGKHESEFDAVVERMDSSASIQFLNEKYDRVRRIAIAWAVNALEIPFRLEPDSLLERIRRVAATPEGSSAKLPDLDSIDSARRNEFRFIVGKLLFGRAPANSASTHEIVTEDPKALAAARLGAILSEEILPSISFRKIVDQKFALGLEGKRFLDLLERERRRARSRVEPLDVDIIELEMVRHWLNPDHPLALMDASTASTVMERVLELDQVSAEDFKRRRNRWYPGDNYPILDVTVFTSRNGEAAPPPKYRFREGLAQALAETN